MTRLRKGKEKPPMSDPEHEQRKEDISRRKKEGVIIDFYGVTQKIRNAGP